MHPVASLGEERLQVDSVRAIRLLTEELALDGIGERARRRPVLRADDVVGGERPEERQAGAPAPRHGEIVVADEVDGRPRGEQGDGDAAEGDRPGEADAPRRGQEQRQQPHDEERLVRGPDQREEGRRDAEEGEPRHARPQRGFDRDRGPDGEGRGEDDVPREAVEEDAEAREEQEGDADEDSRPAAEPQCGTRVEKHRSGEEQRREHDDEDRAADVEDPADDERARPASG